MRHQERGAIKARGWSKELEGCLGGGKPRGQSWRRGPTQAESWWVGGRVGNGISSVEGSVGADCLYFRRIFHLLLLRSGASNGDVLQGKARNLRSKASISGHCLVSPLSSGGTGPTLYHQRATSISASERFLDTCVQMATTTCAHGRYY